MKNKTVRFRIKENWIDGTYFIQKKHWFGWRKYDTIEYFNVEKEELFDLK